jgi:5-(carboxyamino)imidazole ribonucleotide mutase
MKAKTIILMGSEKDLEFSHSIVKTLKTLEVDYEFRVASAHKTPLQVLGTLKEFEAENVVYITVAGRSNALSAFTDANTTKPVIACPPYSDKYGGADLYSSLRVPSGIASVVTIEPEGAALAAAKIFALQDAELEKRIQQYQAQKKAELERANEAIKKMK